MRISVSQLLVLVIVVVLLAAAGFFGGQALQKNNTKTRQAVFLTNGQVYFGYTSKENSKSVTLRDVYYLQVQQPLQPAKENEQPQVSLVKLGNELHGPKDEMRINRDHILFIEDMKDSSRVNEAIANFVKNGSQPSPSPTPSP